MSTSLLIGFYIRDLKEFQTFSDFVRTLASEENSILNVYDTAPSEADILPTSQVQVVSGGGDSEDEF